MRGRKMFSLFFEDDFYSYVNRIYDEIRDYLLKNQNEEFFNRNKEDTCMELFKKYSISFLEVYENIKCISKDNFYYDTDLFGEKIKKPIYTFGVNFSGDENLFRIKTSGPEVHVFKAYFSNNSDEDLLCFDIEFHDKSSLKDVFNRNKNYLFSKVDYINKDVERYNSEIKQEIFRLYDYYESNFHEETELLEELGVERYVKK